MYTECIKLCGDTSDAAAIEKAAGLLKSGGVVAIPTETVYGLAASALDGEAVGEIFKIKGRPQDNPLIAHVCDEEMWARCVAEITTEARALANEFWPGPLTIILEKSPEISPVVTCGLDTVAVRMPFHPAALAVIRAAGMPLAAPSANLSGRPSPTTARHVLNDLEGKIQLILDGGACEVGVESTVITLAGDIPTILRPGIISLADIQRVLPNATISDAAGREPEAGERVASPGMKYKHYSPRAEVTVVRGTLAGFAEYVAPRAGDSAWALCFEGEQNEIPLPCLCYGAKGDAPSQAHGLFSALRELDDLGAKTVWARCPDIESDSESYAVYNRLLRAAGFKVVTTD